MTDTSSSHSRSRRLSDILREVKVAAAERNDVVVEMRDAEQARLELLAQELQPVISDIPAEDEQFDFALSSGLKPRLWIDAVAHVHMGRDRRTYRFVRDTRFGRSVVAETDEMARAADAVSRYVAERIIERQRILEGDFDSLRGPGADSPELRDPDASSSRTGAPDGAASGDDMEPAAMKHDAQPAFVPATIAQTPVHQSRGRSRSVLTALIWFFTGCILGGLAIMAAFADRIGN